MLSTKLKEAAGNSADATLYVDDVFSTWLYTGNGSTQTITNGIDLTGKGGMVWLKGRSGTYGTDAHSLSDTARGVGKVLCSNLTQAEFTNSDAWAPSSFNSNGWSISGNYAMNNNATNYASWTFRKAAKFFDVVTYTGNGTINRVLSHSLGVAPGMVIVKKYSGTGGSWAVRHRSATGELLLDLASAQDAGGFYTVTAMDASTFTVSVNGSAGNESGQSYVAYLFAHDTSSTGIIQCGSFIAGAGNVNLGWEPQWIMFKQKNSTSGWIMFDTMRGWVNSPDIGGTQLLQANNSGAEGATGLVTFQPRATGFSYSLVGDWIYMAIRRPNKPPTSGTQIYNAVENTASGAISNNGFPVDLSILTNRAGNSRYFYDRMRGNVYLTSETTNAEASTSTYLKLDNMIGVNNVGWLSSPNIFYGFKRAPGFFDVVCYTGTGSATTQAHNLGVAPELMIVKERSAVNNWWVYVSSVGNTKYSVLNSTAMPTTDSTAWNNTTPTASVFSIGTSSNVNASTQTFVAYLFATLAGISKVGSYTGNGTGQAIACGFGSGGARFVLIKRTDSTGDWYTYDSARGLTSGSSPYLLLNSTAAEVTGNNGVYASSGGFTLGSTASTTTNISAATYIFLAVA